MSSRTKKIIARVQRYLESKGQTVNKNEIIDALQQAQVQIINETLCLKGSLTIQLVNGQEEYPVAINVVNPVPLPDSKRPILLKAISLLRQDGLSLPLQKYKDYTELRKEAQLLSPGLPPVLASLNGDTLLVSPLPVNPGSSDVITLTFYKSNTDADITEDTDPELPEYWDKAIEAYAIFSLIYDPMAIDLYNREIQAHRHHSFENGTRNNSVKADW